MSATQLYPLCMCSRVSRIKSVLRLSHFKVFKIVNIQFKTFNLIHGLNVEAFMVTVGTTDTHYSYNRILLQFLLYVQDWWIAWHQVCYLCVVALCTRLVCLISLQQRYVLPTRVRGFITDCLVKRAISKSVDIAAPPSDLRLDFLKDRFPQLVGHLSWVNPQRV